MGESISDEDERRSNLAELVGRAELNQGRSKPDVSTILSKIDQGDPAASEQLLPLVYDELRRVAAAKLAQENAGQTLQATALVHEPYLRLVGQPEQQQWDNSRHFFAAAAEAMRRILIERARRKRPLKHGGNRQKVDPAVTAAHLCGALLPRY